MDDNRQLSMWQRQNFPVGVVVVMSAYVAFVASVVTDCRRGNDADANIVVDNDVAAQMAIDVCVVAALVLVPVLLAVAVAADGAVARRLALLAIAPDAAVAAETARIAEVCAVIRPRTRGDWSSRNRTRSQATFSFVFAN